MLNNSAARSLRSARLVDGCKTSTSVSGLLTKQGMRRKEVFAAPQYAIVGGHRFNFAAASAFAARFMA
jgi:hypothetical protein